MKFNFFYFILLILTVSFLCGCNTASVYRLSGENFPARSSDAEIDMFVGKISRPHSSIAILQSKYYDGQTKDLKAEMIKDLKSAARRIGADAVTDIHVLPRKFDGMIVDEQVPFPAWKPGNYFSYFLRGTAIKYISANKEGAEYSGI
jgi:hypothetical protein